MHRGPREGAEAGDAGRASAGRALVARARAGPAMARFPEVPSAEQLHELMNEGRLTSFVSAPRVGGVRRPPGWSLVALWYQLASQLRAQV